MPQSAPIRPSIALAAFAEKFVDGRRILVFGNALSPLSEQLIERGARLVHVCDGDTARVSEAAARNTSQHVSFAPLGGSGLAVRDGAFDVGFVENLSNFADPAATLHKLRRALSSRGIALVAAPNPDVEDALIACSTDGNRTIDYYSLYDLVHREFSVVRMAGQMPFVGYSVAELAPSDEPEPCIDAGFVPGGTEEPEWFIAIAAQAEVSFESFLVVQLPHNQLTKSGSERLLREQLRGARSAERSAVERLSRLEAEQRRLQDVAERHQKDVDLARQIRLLQEELERKESWILQLEARAATADARADEADQALDELRSRDGLESGEAKRSAAAVEDCQKTIERLEAEKCELVRSLNLAEAEAARIARQQLEEKAAAASRLREAEARGTELNQQLEAQRSDAALELALVQATAGSAEEKLSELLKQSEQRNRESAIDEESRATELSDIEQQLRERGERIRLLELQLKQTEAVGARLLRELGRVQGQVGVTRSEVPVELPTLVGSDSPVTTSACPVVGAPSGGEAQPGEATSSNLEVARLADPTVSTVATENWTQGATAATAASTQLSADQASAWSEPQGVAPSEIQALRERLSKLAALAAKQQADLSAHEWRLQQLLLENGALSEKSAKFDEISAELEQARARLTESAALLAQVAAQNQR